MRALFKSWRDLTRRHAERRKALRHTRWRLAVWVAWAQNREVDRRHAAIRIQDETEQENGISQHAIARCWERRAAALAAQLDAERAAHSAESERLRLTRAQLAETQVELAAARERWLRWPSRKGRAGARWAVTPFVCYCRGIEGLRGLRRLWARRGSADVTDGDGVNALEALAQVEAPVPAPSGLAVLAEHGDGGSDDDAAAATAARWVRAAGHRPQRLLLQDWMDSLVRAKFPGAHQAALRNNLKWVDRYAIVLEAVLGALSHATAARRRRCPAFW